MKYIYINILILFLLLSACGKVSVDVDESTYEPKIVVEGYIYPGQSPAKIILTRNYPLNTEIDLGAFYITDANVSITDMKSDETFDLDYDAFSFSYKYKGNDFVIDYNRSYRINLKATIDGKELTASCVTTTPADGFDIVSDESLLGTQKYTTAVENGTKFNLKFKRSPTVDSYITSIVALDASFNNFIEDNIMGLSRSDFADTTDSDDLRYFNYIKNQSQWTQTRLGGGDDLSAMDIEWYSTWFYGTYRVIMYCADENMTEYYLTHSTIQEVDGNLLEPKFHFEGDAIGVFGSAIPDTVYFVIID